MPLGEKQLGSTLENDGNQQKEEQANANDEENAPRQTKVCEVFVEHALSQLKVTGRMVPQNAP